MKTRKYLTIVWCFVFLLGFLSPTITNASVNNSNKQIATPKPITGYAYSTINVTLDDSGIVYERNTNLQAPVDWNQSVTLFSAVLTLTTHGDLLIDFEVEYDPVGFSNYQAYNFSVYHYKQDYGLLTKIVQVPMTLLGITSEAFLLKSSTVYSTITKSYEPKYILSQQLIIRETSAFIAALNEPFKFDNNFIELGSLHDFNFKVFYQKNVIDSKVVEHYNEELKIVSEGSPLSYVSSSKGYEGDIFFTDHQPQPLSSYPRQNVNQTIVYKFVLPSGQSISVGYDPLYNNLVDTKVTGSASISGNTFSMSFNSGDILPNYVSVSSNTPLLAQFSITDYASWTLGILTGLIAILRGLPFYLHRRSTKSIRNNLRKLATQNKNDDFLNEIKLAYNKFLNGKMSLSQYKSIKEESEALLNKE